MLEPWINDCPLHLTSPNAPSKRDVLGTLLLSILAGHKRYAHVTTIRCDNVNPSLLGMNQIACFSSRLVRRNLERNRVILRLYELLSKTLYIDEVDEKAKRSANEVLAGLKIIIDNRSAKIPQALAKNLKEHYSFYKALLYGRTGSINLGIESLLRITFENPRLKSLANELIFAFLMSYELPEHRKSTKYFVLVDCLKGDTSDSMFKACILSILLPDKLISPDMVTKGYGGLLKEHTGADELVSFEQIRNMARDALDGLEKQEKKIRLEAQEIVLLTKVLAKRIPSRNH